MFRKEQESEKEKYEVSVLDTRIPKCGLVLDKVVLKSSAYLSIPHDVTRRVHLEHLLKERCSAKKLNYFSKKLHYDP